MKRRNQRQYLFVKPMNKFIEETSIVVKPSYCGSSIEATDSRQFVDEMIRAFRRVTTRSLEHSWALVTMEYTSLCFRCFVNEKCKASIHRCVIYRCKNNIETNKNCQFVNIFKNVVWYIYIVLENALKNFV